MSDKGSFLSSAHPVAEAARAACRAAHNVGAALIGGVACGRHWELAIREDERWAADLGPDPTVDNTVTAIIGPAADEVRVVVPVVDLSAIEAYLAGQLGNIGRIERAALVARLDAEGALDDEEIAKAAGTTVDALRGHRRRALTEHLLLALQIAS